MAARAGVGERDFDPRLDEPFVVDVAWYAAEGGADAVVGGHRFDHDERQRLMVDAVQSGLLRSLARQVVIAW
jgi:hypothetical protein